MPAHQTSSALNAGPDPTTLEPLKSQTYIEQQLAGFRSGTRRNDEGEQMRVVAAKLTDAEIDGLAAFLSSGRQ